MTSSVEESIRPGTLRITAKSNEPLKKWKDNMTSEAAYCLSQLAGQSNMFANGIRQFYRTEKATYDQIGYPSRAGSVKQEKSLSLTGLTHSFCELADPPVFYTYMLSALRLLIAM